jgi:hypothetical protein
LPTTTNKNTTVGPFGLSVNQMTQLSDYAKSLDANAPQEDAKAGRLADQPFYNPFDVKWGQRQDPQIDITGSESNKPFDQYATSTNNSTTSSRGALNLPQLVDTNLLSQEEKPAKSNNGFNNARALGALGRFSGVGLNMLSAGMDYITDKQKKKEWDNWFRQQRLPDNMYAKSTELDRGDFDINEGIYRPNQLTPPNVGAAVAEYGGTQSLENMNLIKIRLRPVGQEMMKYGGQSGLGMGLDIGQRRVYGDMPKNKDEQVSNTLNPIPRSQANIEAEKGETAYGDLDGDGALEHFNIGGKRHTQGGTPLNVPEGSFIFSDTKKMIIKDPEILDKFGMAPRKEGYTPAEIAKKYDINKYKAIMEDPNTDYVRKNTAQIMIKSFQKKLAELAIIQESIKGFPQGIPEVAKQTHPELAQKYAKEYGLEEEALQDEAGQQEQVMEQGMTEPEEEMMGEGEDQMSEEDMMEQPMSEEGMMEEPMPEARWGGSRLPSYQGAKGSSTVTNRFPVWSPEYQDVISGYIKDKYDVKVPINARDQANAERFTLPSMQSSRDGKRVYGEEAWTDAEHMADFAERQGDFLKENPNWDPTKRGATKKFQDWYNKRATDLGLPQYFGKGQSFQDLDDKFGEYTYSAPSLSPKKAPQPVEEKITPPPTPPYYRPGKVSTTGRPMKTPYGWMTPDIVNLAAASAVAPKRRFSYIAPNQYEQGRLSLEDWRAQAAARQSMYNKQGELLGVYGPTTGQGAAQSVASGQMAEGLAGDIAGVTSRNVDRVNQFLQQERQRKDQFNLLGADRVTQMFGENRDFDAAYDNSRRQYLNNIAKTFGQGWGNASKLGMLNAVNPRFQVDPFSGRSYFTGRAKGWNNFSRSAGQSMASSFPALKNQYMAMGMKEDNAEKMAIKSLTGSKGTAPNYGVDLTQYNQLFS